MSLPSSVARAISFSFVWGVLALVSSRRKNKDKYFDRNQPDMSIENDKETENSPLQLSDELNPIIDHNPVWTQHATSWSMDASLLRRVWNAFGGIVTSTLEQPITPNAVDCRFADSMNIMRSIAASLGLPSNLPESFHKKLPFLRTSSCDLRPLLEDIELLTFYSKSTAFLKAIMSTNETVHLIQNITDKLECHAANLLSSDTRISPQLLTEFSSDVELLMFIEAPAGNRLTPLPVSSAKDSFSVLGDCQYQFASFLSNLSIMSESIPILSHPCLYRWLDLWCASKDIRLQLLAMKLNFNMTAHRVWNKSSGSDQEKSASLNTLAVPKFFLPECHSAATLNDPSITGDTFVGGPDILGPDLFKLDFRNYKSPPASVDIIFINGMLGSVFHTWRQNDLAESSSTSNDTSSVSDDQNIQEDCWPRAWLSQEFPQARIIGVNANLKPFVWNQISPADRLKRGIDERARDILQQLSDAGVGQRPIIWICHSAGGILTKEILRISTSFSNPEDVSNIPPSSLDGEGNDSIFRPLSENDVLTSLINLDHPSSSSKTEMKTPSSKKKRRPESLPKLFSIFINNKNSQPIPDQKNLFSDDYTSRLSTPQSESVRTCGSVMERDSCMLTADDSSTLFIRSRSIADNTLGIVFLSTPHRGNQSLMFLYQFPMVFALTPEAKQLQNSASMLNLHSWFTVWAVKRKLAIMNMVETKDTVINRWYSVCLVPYDFRDHEFSDVVLVPTDHASICKPTSRRDEIYIKISDFIHQQL